MTLQWQLRQEIQAAGNQDNTYTVHFTGCSATDDKTVAKAVEASIDKMISLMGAAVKDESRYLLFDWGDETTALGIYVTDDSKLQDAEVVVKLCLNEWAGEEGDREEQAEKIKFFIKDYLTVCSGFLHYSLIAVFTQGDREKTELL